MHPAMPTGFYLSRLNQPTQNPACRTAPSVTERLPGGGLPPSPERTQLARRAVLFAR
ncbi:hypothetical protein [Chitinimonas naiadis]